jgi:hypothetical protein
MLALSIRQPYAELILRGIKTIEYRSRATRMVGERFWIYASKGSATKRQKEEATDSLARRIWSDDLAVTTPRTGEHPPSWMLELAEELVLGKLPKGVIVGSAVIAKCEKVASGRLSVASDDSGISLLATELYQWHLADVQRIKTPRKPTGHPQPVWFRPF